MTIKQTVIGSQCQTVYWRALFGHYFIYDHINDLDVNLNSCVLKFADDAIDRKIFNQILINYINGLKIGKYCLMQKG